MDPCCWEGPWEGPAEGRAVHVGPGCQGEFLVLSMRAAPSLTKSVSRIALVAALGLSVAKSVREP